MFAFYIYYYNHFCKLHEIGVLDSELLSFFKYIVLLLWMLAGLYNKHYYLLKLLIYSYYGFIDIIKTMLYTMSITSK